MISMILASRRQASQGWRLVSELVIARAYLDYHSIANLCRSRNTGRGSERRAALTDILKMCAGQINGRTRIRRNAHGYPQAPVDNLLMRTCYREPKSTCHQEPDPRAIRNPNSQIHQPDQSIPSRLT